MTQSLRDLQDAMRKCTRCGLRDGCTQVVPGDGPSSCSIMLVGEAPGQEEDHHGRPFVGPSGQLLDKMLTSAGMPRDTVFASNTVKCRPPGNRVPTKSEILECKYHLWDEMMLVQPTVVVTLGRTAADLLIKPAFKSMKSIVGKAHPVDYLGPHGVIVPMYHPSYLLRGNMGQVQEMVKILMKVSHYIQNTERQLCCTIPS